MGPVNPSLVLNNPGSRYGASVEGLFPMLMEGFYRQLEGLEGVSSSTERSNAVNSREILIIRRYGFFHFLGSYFWIHFFDREMAAPPPAGGAAEDTPPPAPPAAATTKSSSQFSTPKMSSMFSKKK